MIKLIKKNDIKKHLKVPYGFAWSDAANGYQCYYILHDQEKVMHRFPVAMANLLKEYSFIDDFKVISDEVYVIHTEIDDHQNDRTRTDLLEDFMREFTQHHSILLISEFETRDFNRKAIAAETNRAKAKYQEVSHD